MMTEDMTLGGEHKMQKKIKNKKTAMKGGKGFPNSSLTFETVADSCTLQVGEQAR